MTLLALLVLAQVQPVRVVTKDGGALEVLCSNCSGGPSSSGGGWVPDGGYIGSVSVLHDGGIAITNWPTTQAVSGTFWPATQPVSGSVSVSNFPASQAVTGTFWQATQPVSGPLTDTQLRASRVPVFVEFDGGYVTTELTSLDAANGGALPANVLAVGMETATQGTTQPTAASAGTLRRPVISTDGALFARTGGPVTWSCSLDNIAASLTQCQAAPGAGLKLYVTDIAIQSTTATAGLFLLRTGTGTNCGTGTASLYPAAATVARFTYPANTAATPSTYRLSTPIAAPAASALCIICTATNTCTVSIQGYTAP